MRLTKLGHACLHIEDGDASVLIDPGSFSSGFEELRGLSAILITHPQAFVVADQDTADQLGQRGITAQVAKAGNTFDAGLSVRVFGEQHAVIHADVPVIPNVGYLVGDTVFHPGDSFTVPDHAVPVLALPTGGPWLKSGEAIDFLRAVTPEIAVPIHERTLAMPEMEYRRFEALKPADTDVRVLADGDCTELG